ncbi:MAG: hypothetical protein QG632_853 [Candidatus Dependentiae bacterium]|nr:hypothetical protein [Candidatus Dependentiae bacterium]
MELSSALVYFGGLVACIGVGAGGAAVGQGYAGGAAAEALARQALGQGPVRQSLLIGCAFLESGCVFSLIITLIYLFTHQAAQSWHVAMTLGLAACAMGIVAGVVGAFSGTVVAAAIRSVARHPRDFSRVFSLMMVAQILLEAPMIFMFIIAFLVKGWAVPTMSMLKVIQLAGASLVFACGTIGPAIGQAAYCRAACEAVGLNMSLYGRIFSFSFIVQAMIETPIIFALLTSLMLMFLEPMASMHPIELLATCIGVMGAVGFGSAGAAIGSGKAAARAVLCMAEQEEQATAVARLAIFCQAIIDTAVIYSLIISVLLIKTCM